MFRIIFFCNLLERNVWLQSDEILTVLFYLLQGTSLIFDPYYLTENMLLFTFWRELTPINNSDLSCKTLRKMLGFSVFWLQESHDFKELIFKHSFDKNYYNNML